MSPGGWGPPGSGTGAAGRPASPDDFYLVIGWRAGLGLVLAERWRAMGRKVILVVPRAPGPDQLLPPGLRLLVRNRTELGELLRDPQRLLAAAEPWRRDAPRSGHVPSHLAIHLVDLTAEDASDLLGLIAGLGPRPGRTIVLSDPAVLAGADQTTGRLAEDEPPAPQTPRAEALIGLEAVARQVRQRGRVVVALRLPPYLYGPGLEPPTPLGPDVRLPDRFLRSDPVLWASGLPPVQPLHAADLAEAVDALLEHPAPEPLYHLAGPEELSWDEVLATLHQASGAQRPPVLETLGPEQIALHRPAAARLYGELAHAPLLDDGRIRAEVYAARRRLALEAPAWLAWCLQVIGVQQELQGEPPGEPGPH